MIGDRRKYLTALITLDADNVKAFADEQGIPTDNFEDLLKIQQIVDLIQGVVDEKNEELASFESIKAFQLLNEFTIENDLLTPTMKVKRNVALERFADQVLSLIHI